MAVHATSGRHSEWYTPEIYIEAARRVMGRIEFDPYSSREANKVVKAAKYNDLECPDRFTWHGKSWMNPPYSAYRGQASDCVMQMVQSFNDGSVEEAIMLVNQSILYQPGPQAAMSIGAICLVNHRIAYVDGGTMQAQTSPPQSNAFIYLNRWGADIPVFVREYEQFGVCLVGAESDRRLN